jgi:hypothetical protein
VEVVVEFHQEQLELAVLAAVEQGLLVKARQV